MIKTTDVGHRRASVAHILLYMYVLVFPCMSMGVTKINVQYPHMKYELFSNELHVCCFLLQKTDLFSAICLCCYFVFLDKALNI